MMCQCELISRNNGPLSVDVDSGGGSASVMLGVCEKCGDTVALQPSCHSPKASPSLKSSNF